MHEIISVIVPVYNREKTISRCLDSLLSSYLQAIEIIVVDDGSTDDSWNIIQSYSARDKRVKPVKLSKNSGVTVARNHGLDMAQGAYVSFVDSDDYVSHDIYAACSSVIRQCEPDMICFNYSIVLEDGRIFPVEPKAITPGVKHGRGYIIEKILPVMANVSDRMEFFIENYSCIKLYKRSVLEQYQIRFDEGRRQWEDRLFQLAFLRYAQSFYMMPDYGYFYVMGNSSFSGKIDKQKFRYILSAHDDYKAIVGDLIDFGVPYEVKYYCWRFNETVLQQFELTTANKDILTDMFRELLAEKRMQLLFSELVPQSNFEKRIKRAIQSENAPEICNVYYREYTRSRYAKKWKRLLSIPRRMVSCLVRRLK